MVLGSGLGTFGRSTSRPKGVLRQVARTYSLPTVLHMASTYASAGPNPGPGNNYRAVAAWTALASIITVTLTVLIGAFYWVDAQVKAQAENAPSTSSGTTAAAHEHGTTTTTTTTAGSAGSAVEIARAATDVPPPITRTVPTTVQYNLQTVEVEGALDPANGTTYKYWTFNGKVPGPMLRVMQGDTVVIHLSNADGSAFTHSIDLHAVSGTGGGSGASQTLKGANSTFSFKALNPGLYLYHCATAPVATHVANGMYGMILVEPPGGLPRVDREYYVMQGEMYTNAAFGTKGHVELSETKLLSEQPNYYVFDGRVGALTGAGALHASVGDRVRIYFGVGTFKSSAFHVIGTIFDTVYPDGGVGGPLERNVGLVNVPAGGTTMAEIVFRVPGTYVIVDHALQRVQEGASGQIIVDGPPDPSIFNGSAQMTPH